MHFDFIIYEIVDTQHLRHLLKLSRFFIGKRLPKARPY